MPATRAASAAETAFPDASSCLASNTFGNTSGSTSVLTSNKRAVSCCWLFSPKLSTTHARLFRREIHYTIPAAWFQENPILIFRLFSENCAFIWLFLLFPPFFAHFHFSTICTRAFSPADSSCKVCPTENFTIPIVQIPKRGYTY